MKKRFILLISILFLFLSMLTGCSVNNLRPLKIGVRSDVPNFGYKSDDGFYGFEIDVANAMAEKMNYSIVEFVEINSDNREEMLENGDIDCLVACYSYTDERNEKFNLSTPYYEDEFVFLVARTSLFRDISDLNHTVIGVRDSSSDYDKAKQTLQKSGINDYKIEKFDNYSDLLANLNSGDIDAVAIDYCMSLEFGKEMSVSYLSGMVLEVPFCVASRKDSPISADINKAIKLLVNDGTITELKKKWGA